MTVRTTIFWTHLAIGLTTGIVIAIMSATGVAIAFEHEILEWAERDVRTVSAPAGTARLSLAQLDAALRAERPRFKATSVVIASDPNRAYEYRAGREGSVFVDPYSGRVADQPSGGVRTGLETLEAWHRWLGMQGERRGIGKLITGICNLGFLVLCITGAYLWWPRNWAPSALRPLVWFVGGRRGKARNSNWHNVFGLWNVAVLIVLVATAVVFSFSWAHRLVFTLAGEEPPAGRGPGMFARSEVEVPPPDPGAPPLPLEAAIAQVKRAYPRWESISIDLARDRAPVSAVAPPLQVTVSEPALFPSRGSTQVSIDPYRGDVLATTGFKDRSPGTRARIWIRFLHTGEAFGLGGKIVATLSTAASLMLVYTGFALSWFRFFGPGRRAAKAAASRA